MVTIDSCQATKSCSYVGCEHVLQTDTGSFEGDGSTEEDDQYHVGE